MDYNLWLGPAPMRPFNPNRFHYNWHWFWNTGNGDIGNQGPHQMDLARWGLNKNTLPAKVCSTGGKFLYDDDQETPNTQLATFEYDDCRLVFEVRGLPTLSESSISPFENNFIGNLFFGSEGTMALDGGGFRIYRGENRELADQATASESKVADTGPHVENSLRAVRNWRHTDLAADILEGHLSTTLCHLANISYRTGHNLIFDPATETLPNDSEANSYLSRDYRKPFVVERQV